MSGLKRAECEGKREKGRKTFLVHELFAASAVLFLLCLLIFNFSGFGDRISVGTRFSVSVQTHCMVRPTSSKISDIFSGVKRPERGAGHPPSQSPKLQSTGKLIIPL